MSKAIGGEALLSIVQSHTSIYLPLNVFVSASSGNQDLRRLK